MWTIETGDNFLAICTLPQCHVLVPDVIVVHAYNDILKAMCPLVLNQVCSKQGASDSIRTLVERDIDSAASTAPGISLMTAMTLSTAALWWTAGVVLHYY